MHILWLTENYPPRRGGMAQACDRIVSNLRQAGTNIDVVSLNSSGQLIKSVQQQNGRLILAPASDNPGHVLNCLFNYLEDPGGRQQYDCVVAFGGYLPILALPVFKSWLGTRAVTMLRGNDFDLGVFMPQRRAMLADALKGAGNRVKSMSLREPSLDDVFLQAVGKTEEPKGFEEFKFHMMLHGRH